MVNTNKEEKSRDDVPQKTAMEAAAAYLASRTRTREEVRLRLKSRGYGEDEIGETVEELTGLGYLDDYRYSMAYYEYNREKKRGSLRAYRELLEKGVDDVTASNARADYLYENEVNEYEDALEIARREWREENPVADPEKQQKLKAKIGRKLEAKGFERGDIFRVLEEIRHEDICDS